MSWTIQYHDAGGIVREVGFSALAALESGQVVGDGWSAAFMSHRASTVQLRLPGVPPHIAPAIPFESRMKIYSDRALVAGVYSSGVIRFQGLRTDRNGTADPHKSSSSYQFDDEWYFLDHCQFYQTWNRVTDNTPGAVVTTSCPMTQIVLYQPNPGQIYYPDPVGGLISTGQQIHDILAWAIRMGANLQIGTIDPAIYQAVYPVQNIKCGDAIRMCLRLHPDCFTEIDYTTTPPTFHVRRRASLTAVTLPYSHTDGDGQRHTVTDIQPRPELRATRVALFYRVITDKYLIAAPLDIYPNSNLVVQGPVSSGELVGGAAAPYTVDGTPIVGTAMENIAGSGTASIKVGAAPGLRALDFSIDLQGPRSTLVVAKIKSYAFDPTDLAWWQKKIPSLKSGIPAIGDGALALLSATVNGGGAKDITVTDDTGAAINLATYGYELDPQSAVMSWMPGVQVVGATVSAFFSYKKSSTVGAVRLTNEAKEHQHHVRIKLVNHASATFQFSQYLTAGEDMPVNLAQYVFESLDWLQYSFSHRCVASLFNGWLKPGLHAINLSGGASAWETMNACLQQTQYRMHLGGDGVTFDNFDVRCGPVEHLEPGQLVQLLNVFANRDLAKIDTNERIDGIPSPGQTVEMPDDGAQENSVPAVSIPVTSFNAFVDGGGGFWGVKNSATDLANGRALN